MNNQAIIEEENKDNDIIAELLLQNRDYEANKMIRANRNSALKKALQIKSSVHIPELDFA